MNSLLEKIHDIEMSETFAEKIIQNDYIHSISMNNGDTYKSSNLVDLILMKYESSLSFGETCKLEIEKEKVRLVENIEKDYNKYKFNKKILSVKKIQNGFQNMNAVSSLFFLSEYYQKNFCIIDGMTLFITNYKDYEKEYLQFINGRFSFKDSDNGKYQQYIGIFDSDIFHKDILSEYIYETNLKPISKYTVSELRGLSAGQVNIKLNKKDLYRELYKLNLN